MSRKNDYNGVVLFVLGLILFLGLAVSVLDSEDVDALCSTDNRILRRLSGTWVCSTLNSLLDESCSKDNSLLVRKNGQWICTSDAHLEEDLRMAAQIGGVRGANTPTWATFVGTTEVLQFSPTLMREVWFETQLPHGRKENSTLGLHVHWTPTNTNTGKVTWCIEYVCANIDTVYPGTSNTVCNSFTAAGTALTHQYSVVHNYTNTLKYSATCNFRLFRNATASTDTYNANANLLSFDLHYISMNFGEDI